MNKKNKINPLIFAKFQAILFGLIGLLLGIIYSFGGLILDILVSLNWLDTEETLGLGYGTLLAFGAIIIIPLLGILIGFVTGILEAFLYNIWIMWFPSTYVDWNNKMKN